MFVLFVSRFFSSVCALSFIVVLVVISPYFPKQWKMFRRRHSHTQKKTKTKKLRVRRNKKADLCAIRTTASKMYFMQISGEVDPEAWVRMGCRRYTRLYFSDTDNTCKFFFVLHFGQNIENKIKQKNAQKGKKRSRKRVGPVKNRGR